VFRPRTLHAFPLRRIAHPRPLQVRAIFVHLTRCAAAIVAQRCRRLPAGRVLQALHALLLLAAKRRVPLAIVVRETAHARVARLVTYRRLALTSATTRLRSAAGPRSAEATG